MTQYLAYNRRDSSGNGHIAIRSRATLGDTWGSAVDIIDYNETGLDAGVTTTRFPQLYPNGSGYKLFFSTEESTGNPMKIWSADCATSDPTDPLEWGDIVELLGPSGVASDWRKDGVAQPFVIRYAPGDYRMLVSGYLSGVGTGRWQGGMATATSIDGPWTLFEGNPIFPLGTRETQIDGAKVSARIVNVLDGTELAAGVPVVIGGKDGNGEVAHRLSRVRSVATNQVVLYNRLETADTQYVVSADSFSVAPRFIRPNPTGAGWEVWATVFKYSGGVETTVRYQCLDADPMTGTWTLGTDHGFPWVPLAKRPTHDEISAENVTTIFTASTLNLTNYSISPEGRFPADILSVERLM